MGVKLNALAAILSQFSGAASAAPSIVAAQLTDTATGTNRTVALGTAVGSGNSLIVVVRHSLGVGAVTLTDNQGNTYTNDYDGADIFTIFRCHNITNAPTQLNFTNASAVLRVRIYQVAGLANSAPAAAGGATTANSVTTVTRTHTAAAANELIVIAGKGSADTTRTSDFLPLDATDPLPAVGVAARGHTWVALAPSSGSVSTKYTVTATTSLVLVTVGYAAA